MKKLLILLSVLTISGTAMPNVIAASPYEKQLQTNTIIKDGKNNNQQTESKISSSYLNNNNSRERGAISIIREIGIKKTEEVKDYLIKKIKNVKNLNKLNVNKNYYPKEQIDFINNNFLYKFNVDYDDNKIWGTVSSGSHDESHESVILDDWTKYAKNWEEFEKKFSQIEFTGLKAQLGGQGETVTVKEFKMPVKKNYSLRLIKYEYHFIVCWQISYINLQIFPVGKKLVIKHNYHLKSANAINRTWASLKYNSIRLIGEVDLNPLVEHTKESYKQLQDFIKEKEKELKIKENDPSYNKETLKQEKIVFEKDIKWRITMVNHNLIQDLLIIENSRKIENIEKEIEELKERLDALEKNKNCIESIFKAGAKKGLSKSKITEIAVGTFLTEGLKGISSLTNPISLIVKGFIKGFLSGSFLEGINCIL